MKAKNMNVSDNGVNLVKQWEGEYLKAYWDDIGSVWTIGYGHTKNVYKGQTITLQEAHELLREDLQSHMWKAKEQITSDLTQNQYDAIASFCFNLGANILTGSKLLTYLNESMWDEACNEMMDYCHGGGRFVQGLWNRRDKEVKLFKEGLYEKQCVQEREYDSSWFTEQRGVFTANTTIKVRKEPSVNSEHIRTLYDGSRFEYDGFGYEEHGYVWLRGVDGTYCASGETENGKRENYWGSFE